MRFGVARDIVTPDVLTQMGGYGSLYGKFFQGIHDDLYVKTLVLDDGTEKVILISLDLLFHDFTLTETIGEYLEKKHGLDRNNLVISYTHTHAGPALAGYSPGVASPEYEKFLPERIKSCIDRALVNMFEGTISYASVEGDWNCCRRKFVDGQWRNTPNWEGDRDQELALLKVCDTAGQLRVIMVNYSCHPVTLGATLWLSSEYPGWMCQLLDTEFYGATTIFFQSAGGCSVPQVAVDNGRRKQCTFAEMAAMSAAMAEQVKGAINADAMQPVELNLAARQFMVSLPTEVYPREFFQKILDDPNVPDCPHRNEAQWVLDNYDTSGNTVDLHAAIVRLNADLYIAFLCGEVTYPVKQHVKKAFGEKAVIFIGYGDAAAYIPDDRYISEGGYEVDGSVVEFRLKGRLQPGVDKIMIERFSEHLSALNA